MDTAKTKPMVLVLSESSKTLMPVVLVVPVVALVVLVVLMLGDDSSVWSMYNGINGSIMPTVALAMVAAIATTKIMGSCNKRHPVHVPPLMSESVFSPSSKMESPPHTA